MIVRSSQRALTAAACLALVAAGLVAPGRVLAEDASVGQRILTLKGEGSASGTPDMAWLTMGVETNGDHAEDALRANNDAMTKVIAALKADGLYDRDVQTANLSIEPEYSSDPKQANVVVGYRVSNNVTIRIRDLKKAGTIVDQVVTLGSNDVSDLNFDVDDPTAVRNEARVAAMRDALAKAKLYAGAAGIELGPILKIEEEEGSNPLPRQHAYRRVKTEAVASVEAGELTFHAAVNVTWSLK